MKRKKPLKAKKGLKSKTPLKSKKALQSRSKLKHRSQKMEKLYDERRPFVKKILDENPHCQACPIFATHDKLVTYVRRPSVDVHELVRRSQGGSILSEDNVIAVCRQCHQRIGNFPELAFQLGLAKHSWDDKENNS
jgi:5-methylcytosine-specific restriction endonuclease McrA